MKCTGLNCITCCVRRVGMMFMPQDPEAAAAAATIVEKVVAAEGRCRIAGWRDVPCDDAVVGRMAKAEQPIIRQVCKPAPTGVPRALLYTENAEPSVPALPGSGGGCKATWRSCSIHVTSCTPAA